MITFKLGDSIYVIPDEVYASYYDPVIELPDGSCYEVAFWLECNPPIPVLEPTTRPATVKAELM